MAAEDELARRLLVGAERVEAHRVALSRNALVWWEGAAADRYRQLVAARVADLGLLAEALRVAAGASRSP